MKLNGYDLIELQPSEYDVITGLKDSLTIVEYKVPQDVVEKIKNTKRIAIKMYRNNGLTVVYVLPEDTLEEWKQVIATKE